MRAIRQAGPHLGRDDVLRLSRWWAIRATPGAGPHGTLQPHGTLRLGRRTGLRAVLLAAGVAVTAACAGSSSGAASGVPSAGATGSSGPGRSGSTSVPAPTGGAEGEARLIGSRDDLSSLQPQAWESWRLVDPTTVEVVFIGGSTNCYGVHVDVVETDQDVTINLSTGSLPGVDACTDEAVLLATHVTLREELGDREVRQDAES
ncbi:hypothetical protein [Actinomyces lilanjuaniae]|uniref:hypothetical protein n=1 Tax=Actinomyces lilanjuaniae TaxID=2321394 RepID=UPI001FAAA20F|nr:hypothetical protein [Actinomyces lilanjuaniae]